MRARPWAPGAAAVLVVVVVVVIALSVADRAASPAHASPANTAPVQMGKLSAVVSQDGTLSYRARPDGSPYSVINLAHGVYTALPEAEDHVGCGGVLYRVDQHPVLLLCGAVPAYRTLHVGDAGQDVRELNDNLRIRGAGDMFTTRTEAALQALQRRKGVHVTGSLALGDAVFLPGPVRIAGISGEPGALARPGARVLSATSDTLSVQVAFDPSQQGQVKLGDRAQVTLPGNTTVPGKVVGFGPVAQVPAGQGSSPADATIPTYIGLDDPAGARGLDRAPVRVDITTAGVANALSVPVTALVGRSGGGFAVEVAGAGGRRDLIGVRVGLFDTAGGRVQVQGNLRAGDRVVVPSP